NNKQQHNTKPNEVRSWKLSQVCELRVNIDVGVPERVRRPRCHGSRRDPEDPHQNMVNAHETSEGLDSRVVIHIFPSSESASNAAPTLWRIPVQTYVHLKGHRGRLVLDRAGTPGPPDNGRARAEKLHPAGGNGTEKILVVVQAEGELASFAARYIRTEQTIPDSSKV